MDVRHSTNNSLKKRFSRYVMGLGAKQLLLTSNTGQAPPFCPCFSQAWVLRPWHGVPWKP